MAPSITLPPAQAFESFQLHVRNADGTTYRVEIVGQSYEGSYARPKLIDARGWRYEEIQRPEDDPVDYPGARFGVHVKWMRRK
jgi:hypothetical protein